MTDLPTLLRDHLAHDEPRTPPDLAPALRRGRRRLRARRALAVTGAGGLAAAATVVGVLLGPSGPGAERDRGLDPTRSSGLDPRSAPAVIEQQAARLLSRTFDDLPEPTVSATDGRGVALGPADYDRAAALGVGYRLPGGRTVSVDLVHSPSDAEGDPRRDCERSLADGTLLRCAVVGAEGTLAQVRLWALRREAGSWVVASASELDAVDPDRLRFERSVKVVRSSSLLVYAREEVAAGDLDAAEAALRVPPADLVELATDPALWLAAPPAGEDCPAGADPGPGVTCSRAVPVNPAP